MDVQDRVIAIIAEQALLEPSEVGVDQSLQDLGIDSLALVESIFAYPGLGRLLLQAISQRDLPLLQGVALLSALIYTLANLLADVVYFWVNPRIRYS